MKKVLIILVFIAAGSNLVLSQHEAQKYVEDPDMLVKQRLEQWQDLKFGLLMHWGPYCQWGIVESWSICPEDYGWCERKIGENPDSYFEYVKEYEALKNTFNPGDFDPAKWARAAKNAGMRYVIFTTKHHDGFCMYDSEYTSYKITDPDCPFSIHEKADVTMEIFDAFRKQGFWTGAYFSKPDWHSEYYWWPYFPPKDRNVNYDPDVYPERWEQFVSFTHNQVLELVSDYGPLDILWLDGGWVAKQPEEEIRDWYRQFREGSSNGYLKRNIISQDIRMDELVNKARNIQPGIIVVDRAVPGVHQNYLTPENRVPEDILPYPWESCIISGGGWSWTENASYMAPGDLIHLFVDIISKGGNLLLNIAPGPDGQWDEGAYQLLGNIGKWMKVNSEAVYGSRPAKPYQQDNYRYIKKSDTLYMIYLEDRKKKGMPQEIRISNKILKDRNAVSLLGTEDSLSISPAGENLKITIPKTIREHPPAQFAWIFRFTYN